MRRFILCGLAVALLALPTMAKEKPKFDVHKITLDPVCITSENLRFQLGELVLSVPRKAIRGYTCPDPKQEKQCTIKNKRICQRPEDVPFNITSLRFQIGEVGAYDAKCDERIYVNLESIEQPMLMESKEDLIKRIANECTHDLYFNTCQPYLNYDPHTKVHINYFVKCRPTETTAETLNTVIKTIEQYKVKSE